LKTRFSHTEREMEELVHNATCDIEAMIVLVVYTASPP
jgi:hypothetical protein